MRKIFRPLQWVWQLISHIVTASAIVQVNFWKSLGVLVIPVLTGIWAVIKGTSGPLAFAVGIWVLVGMIWAINGVMALHKRSRVKKLKEGRNSVEPATHTVTFYSDRSKLPYLNDIIKGAGRISAAWMEGSYPAHQQVFSLGNIRRAILLDPDGKHIEYVAKEISRSVEHIRQSILFTKDRAQEGSVEVRYYDGPITSAIIAKEDGWIRIDTNFPFLAGAERPSYNLVRDTHIKAFDAILDAYEKLWANSRDPNKEGSFQKKPRALHETQDTPIVSQRKLTNDQHLALVNRLREFSGSQVYISYYQDSETRDYANDIFAAFIEAGWKGSSSNYSGDLLRFSSDIRIWAKDQEMAMKFGTIFLEAGIGKVLAQRKSNLPKEHLIEILVGPAEEVNLLNLQSPPLT